MVEKEVEPSLPPAFKHVRFTLFVKLLSIPESKCSLVNFLAISPHGELQYESLEIFLKCRGFTTVLQGWNHLKRKMKQKNDFKTLKPSKKPCESYNTNQQCVFKMSVLTNRFDNLFSQFLLCLWIMQQAQDCPSQRAGSRFCSGEEKIVTELHQLMFLTMRNGSKRTLNKKLTLGGQKVRNTRCINISGPFWSCGTGWR